MAIFKNVIQEIYTSALYEHRALIKNCFFLFCFFFKLDDIKKPMLEYNLDAIKLKIVKLDANEDDNIGFY